MPIKVKVVHPKICCGLIGYTAQFLTLVFFRREELLFLLSIDVMEIIAKRC